MILGLLFGLIIFALSIYVLLAIGSAVGFFAGIVSLFVAPPWKRKRYATGAVQSGTRPSRTREDIMRDAIPGTYAWDLKIAQEQRVAARKAARTNKRRKIHA